MWILPILMQLPWWEMDYNSIMGSLLWLLSVLSLAKKEGRGKTVSQHLKWLMMSPGKAAPVKILENKMASYTHFMMLRTMTAVMRLLGDFHVAE